MLRKFRIQNPIYFIAYEWTWQEPQWVSQLTTCYVIHHLQVVNFSGPGGELFGLKSLEFAVVSSLLRPWSKTLRRSPPPLPLGKT